LGLHLSRADWAVAVVLGLASLGLTYFLWFRSGLALEVRAFTKFEAGSIHIEVVSVGRLPATLRHLELRDEVVTNSSSKTLNRWVIEVPLGAESIDLAPTDFFPADVDVKTVQDRSAGVPEVTLRAFATRGDGKVVSSKPVRFR
jgi:hypothetical protein